jgi:hypothetical protein
VDFGSSKSIKVAIVITANTNWQVTFGDSADFTQNQNIFSTSSEYGKEILVERDGRFLTI